MPTAACSKITRSHANCSVFYEGMAQVAHGSRPTGSQEDIPAKDSRHLPEKARGPGQFFEDPISAGLDALEYVDEKIPDSRNNEYGGGVVPAKSKSGRSGFTYRDPMITTVLPVQPGTVAIRLPLNTVLWFHNHPLCRDCAKGPSGGWRDPQGLDIPTSRLRGIPGVVLETGSRAVYWFTGNEHETVRIVR
jgi:hypothetical protein